MRSFSVDLRNSHSSAKKVDPALKPPTTMAVGTAALDVPLRRGSGGRLPIEEGGEEAEDKEEEKGGPISASGARGSLSSTLSSSRVGVLVAADSRQGAA